MWQLAVALVLSSICAPAYAQIATTFFAESHSSYAVLTPNSGDTVNLPNMQKVILTLAAPLAALTLVPPAAPNDGQTLRISTQQRIDALTISNSDWAVDELPQNGVIDFTYVESLTEWVRG